MESAYWIAWIVLYAFGIGLIALFVYPLRRRFYLAFFVGSMGVFWMLVPIPFNDVHWAPLFITLTFQLFLDPAANYALSATAATVGTFTILAATIVLYGFNLGYRHVVEFTHRRLRSMRRYRPSGQSASEMDESNNDVDETSKVSREIDDLQERR